MSNPSDVGHVRLKRAETTSTLSAGMLGAGIALLIANLLRSYAGLVFAAAGALYNRFTRWRPAAVRADVAAGRLA